MIVLNILGYFGRNKQNSYAALNQDIDYMLKFGCNVADVKTPYFPIHYKLSLQC